VDIASRRRSGMRAFLVSLAKGCKLQQSHDRYPSKRGTMMKLSVNGERDLRRDRQAPS